METKGLSPGAKNMRTIFGFFVAWAMGTYVGLEPKNDHDMIAFLFFWLIAIFATEIGDHLGTFIVWMRKPQT